MSTIQSSYMQTIALARILCVLPVMTIAFACQSPAKNNDMSKPSIKEELNTINTLLRDTGFALTVASAQEAAYYTAQGKTPPPFFEGADSTIQKSEHEEKIATNLAGFYAVECGVGYLAATQNKLPSSILQAIITDSVSAGDKQLLERFANATWKASQPFRSLNRITRDIFKPFDLLTPEEIDKDWAQIQAAAKTLLKALQEK
jgi:hypothetical protein